MNNIHVFLIVGLGLLLSGTSYKIATSKEKDETKYYCLIFKMNVFLAFIQIVAISFSNLILSIALILFSFFILNIFIIFLMKEKEKIERKNRNFTF